MPTLRTLVVDDEPGIRSGIQRILRDYRVGYPFLEEDFDFDIILAETGEEALEILSNEDIDIVLLDNQLPGMNGIDVLAEMKKQDISSSVMMITSYASLDLAVKATGQGAYNFVPKPFTPQELKMAIEALAKNLFLKKMAADLAREGKEARFQFLSVLSHELKSPINAVEGYLRIIQDRQAGHDITSYDMMVDRSLERLKGMRNLIADLLDLNRIESGTRKRGDEVVDLVECVRIAIDTMDPMAKQNRISIHFDPEGNSFVKAGRDDLQMIVNNLVSNAIKYNRDEGEVIIKLLEKAGMIEFSVQDTGIGMSEGEKEKLFGEFVRIRNSKTVNIPGSGLGLSIVKKLVSLYDGSITVESIPNIGSTFTVNLPAKLNN